MFVAQNLEIIEERILKACLRAGRKRDEITLMGVTKFQPIEAVEEAWNAGLSCFGESRVQEAAAKWGDFRAGKPDMELHLIGALQRNKAKTAAALFDCVQSIDREDLARELAKHTAERSAPLPLLLEFRKKKKKKSGFTDVDALFKAVEFILACPSLRVRGLMTIAPNTSHEKQLRAAFRRLVKLRQELELKFPELKFPSQEGQCSWSCLSMGMSNDFELAIEEGSTLLRIGTAIFGERN
jgi:pyridoxal phosphate enzyme (YggS family)